MSSLNEVITTMSACSSGTLTNVLPHSNAMHQTQDTAHPVTECRHRANLSGYSFMWSITLDAITTHLNVLGLAQWRDPSRLNK